MVKGNILGFNCWDWYSSLFFTIPRYHYSIFCMPQGAKILFFISHKLINIGLGPIPLPQSESWLLHERTIKKSATLTFYINNIFGAFKMHQEQFIFLYDLFFLCKVWAWLKFKLSKLTIEMTKIFALGKEDKIDKKVKLKPNKIKKIFICPISQDQTEVKAFFKTIQSIKR